MSHHLRLIDITNAFVQTETTNHDMFVRQPKGYEQYDKHGNILVCKLNKFLYGLLQSSREFNAKLTRILLEDFGFKQSESDTCVFVQTNTKYPITLTAYVDDLIVSCSSLEAIEKFAQEFNEFFPIKMEILTQILGMTITNDPKAGIVTMNQQHAINKMLQEYGYENAEALPTPMENGWHPNLHTEDREKVAQFPIKETLGALGHIANTTRLDIAFAVGRLQRERSSSTNYVSSSCHKQNHAISHRNINIEFGIQKKLYFEIRRRIHFNIY